jgi:desampylase
VAHARAAAPDECCGLLIARGGALREAVRARNAAAEPRHRFLIDPRDHIAARRRGRSQDEEVCGFYHSHPRGRAEPSPEDLAEAAYEGYLFLIVGLGIEPPELRLFTFDEGRFVERPIRGGRA